MPRRFASFCSAWVRSIGSESAKKMPLSWGAGGSGGSAPVSYFESPSSMATWGCMAMSLGISMFRPVTSATNDVASDKSICAIQVLPFLLGSPARRPIRFHALGNSLLLRCRHRGPAPLLNCRHVVAFVLPAHVRRHADHLGRLAVAVAGDQRATECAIGEGSKLRHV